MIAASIIVLMAQKSKAVLKRAGDTKQGGGSQEENFAQREAKNSPNSGKSVNHADNFFI